MVLGQVVGRRFVLGAMLAGVALPVWADAPATSPRPVTRGGLDRGADSEVARLIEAAKLGGAVGFCVADAATGVMLESGGADQPMAPASVCKAVTSLYALEKLGPVHRFTTRVMRVGAVVDGRLEGDLILAGGGDPTLDTDSLGDLVAALAATGLREVTGRFLAYGAAIPERERISADQPDHVGYNPAISGLMLNFNRVYFEWKRANGDWALGMDARGERFVPPVHMASARLAKREVPVFTYERGEKEDRWTVAQSALGQDGSRWLPVRHPAIYVAEVFATLCRAQGIVLKEAEVVTVLPEGAVQMVAHDSAVLTDLLRSMLKFSTNLTAEAVGLAASGAGTLEGSAAAMTDWARRRFGIAGRLGDHSGLGPNSRITAADMMRVMIGAKATQTGKLLGGLMRDHGLVDAEGNERKDSRVRVRAKSGTLNFVSCLSGYIGAPEGRELAFAIFTGDLPRRDAIPIAERETPKGVKSWVRRSRRLQGQLIARWADAYL